MEVYTLSLLYGFSPSKESIVLGIAIPLLWRHLDFGEI